MRIFGLLMTLAPVAATAQVDVTPTAGNAVAVVELLQGFVGPGQAPGDPVEWCLADAHRLAVGEVEGPLAQAMLGAAERYDALGVRRANRQGGGLATTPGAEVTVRVSDRFVCRTTVREPGVIRG